MTIEEWENRYEKLNEFYEDFIRRLNQRRNDFKFHKQYLENEDEKRMIIQKCVSFIKINVELYDLLINDLDQDMIDHLEARGFYDSGLFQNYSFKLLQKVDNKIKELSA